MPSVNGVRFNGIPLDLESVSFTDLLRSAGYRSALIGKCHLQGMVEAESMAPRREWPACLKAPPESLGEAMHNRHSDDEYKMEMQQIWDRESNYGERIEIPYYGFDDVQFCLGHGDTVTGHYKRWPGENSSTSIQAQRSILPGPFCPGPGFGLITAFKALTCWLDSKMSQLHWIGRFFSNPQRSIRTWVLTTWSQSTRSSREAGACRSGRDVIESCHNSATLKT